MRLQVTYLLWAVLLFNFLQLEIASAQNAPIILNEQSGLPSSTLYDVKVSKDQKIWTTTDKGVSCYNGRTYENYGLGQGLPVSFSWKLFEDSHGRMWLHNNETPFTYIKDGKVHRVGEKHEKFYINNIYENGDGLIYINSLKSKQCFVIDEFDQVKIKYDSLYFGKRGDSILWLSSRQAKDKFETLYAFYFIDNWMIYESKKNPRDLGRGVSAYNFKTQEKIDLNKYTEFQFAFHTITVTLNGSLHIIHNKGVFELSIFPDKIILNSVLEHIANNSGFAIDGNKNQWLSTQGEGLNYYGRLDQDVVFKDLSKHSSKIIGAFKINETKIGVIDNYENLLIVNQNNTLEKSIPIPFAQIGIKFNYFQQFLLVFNGTILYVLPKDINLENLTTALDDCAEIGMDSKSISAHQSIYKGHPKTVNAHKDEILFGTNSKGISLKASGSKLSINKIFSGYVYAINRTDSSTYLIGNHDGLYKANNQSTQLIWKEEGVNDLFYLENKLMMKSYASKLFEITADSLYRIEAVQNKYSSSFCINNKLAMLNSNELDIYSPKDWQPTYTANSYNGYSAGAFVDLLPGGNYFVLVTENGLYRIPYDAKNREAQLESFKFERVILNGKSITEKKILLDNEYSNLNIELFANDYPKNDRLQFSYRLAPNDKEWNKTNSSNFLISRIPFETEGLELKAEKPDGSQYGETISLSIYNPAPFHKKKYFGLWLILASIAIAALVVYFFQQLRIKRMKEHFDSLENKHKMLSMQMKPHFLSNVFNTLQSSVLLDKVEDTSRFIKEVDAYLRETLKNSQIQFQSLKQEIELAKKYAAIEQRRYENEIRLEIDQSCFKHPINLPVFTLQPIVENAIWHGLRKANRKEGLIKIDVQTDEKYFTVRIHDNGKGLGEKDETGNNIALKNIEKRLSLIDQNKRKKHIEFEELIEGLIVKIYVPRKIKNINSRRRTQGPKGP